MDKDKPYIPGAYTAKDFVNFIESKRFDKLGPSALETIAEEYLKMEKKINAYNNIDKTVEVLHKGAKLGLDYGVKKVSGIISKRLIFLYAIGLFIACSISFGLGVLIF